MGKTKCFQIALNFGDTLKLKAWQNKLTKLKREHAKALRHHEHDKAEKIRLEIAGMMHNQS